MSRPLSPSYRRLLSDRSVAGSLYLPLTLRHPAPWLSWKLALAVSLQGPSSNTGLPVRDRQGFHPILGEGLFYLDPRRFSLFFWGRYRSHGSLSAFVWNSSNLASSLLGAHTHQKLWLATTPDIRRKIWHILKGWGTIIVKPKYYSLINYKLWAAKYIFSHTKLKTVH